MKITEIFLIQGNNASLDGYYSKLRIYGVNYQPYTYSFLCWGVEQVGLIYQTNLIIVITFMLVKSSLSAHLKKKCMLLIEKQLYKRPNKKRMLSDRYA